MKNYLKEQLAKKTVGAIIGCVVLAVVVFGLYFGVTHHSHKDDLTVIQIIESLEPASDLVSTKYYYTDADIYEDHKEAFGVAIPFTKDKAVFTYEGVINVGIDLSAVKYEVDNGGKKEEKVITITLPEFKIISNEIDANSFKFPYFSNSIFNQNEIPGFTKLIAELKDTKAQELIAKPQFMDTVRINTENVMRKFLAASDATKDYQVVFK